MQYNLEVGRGRWYFWLVVVECCETPNYVMLSRLEQRVCLLCHGHMSHQTQSMNMIQLRKYSVRPFLGCSLEVLEISMITGKEDICY
jgi:hypothetical protein